MKLRVITPPASEPATVAELKAYAHIDGSDDDTLLTSCIVAARQAVENYTNRALITQTLETAFDATSEDAVELPRPNLVSVTSVKSYDDAATETTLEAADYLVDSYSEPGVVSLVSGASWGTQRARNALIVRYVAGYGAASDVPQALRTAVLEQAKSIYDGDELGAGEVLYPRAKGLARTFRVVPV